MKALHVPDLKSPHGGRAGFLLAEMGTLLDHDCMGTLLDHKGMPFVEECPLTSFPLVEECPLTSYSLLSVW